MKNLAIICFRIVNISKTSKMSVLLTNINNIIYYVFYSFIITIHHIFIKCFFLENCNNCKISSFTFC